jgi:hypothetical protein
MTTASDATSYAQLQGGIKYSEGQGRAGVVHFHVNLADLVAGLGAPINALTDDTVDIWDIPIGTKMKGCLLHVVTAATALAAGVAATALIEIGDAESAAGYLAETTIKTVGYTGMIVTDAYAVGTKVYSAAGLLRLTFDGLATSITAGVFDIYLFCFFADIPQAEVSSTWT